MFRSGGTATTATIGAVAEGTTPTPQVASAPVASRSAHDSAAAWRLPRLNGTTAARSRAGSAAATNPDSFPRSQTKGGRCMLTHRPPTASPTSPDQYRAADRLDRSSPHGRAPVVDLSSLFRRPKNRGPFHLVPVIAKATLERLS